MNRDFEPVGWYILTGVGYSPLTKYVYAKEVGSRCRVHYRRANAALRTYLIMITYDLLLRINVESVSSEFHIPHIRLWASVTINLYYDYIHLISWLLTTIWANYRVAAAYWPHGGMMGPAMVWFVESGQWSEEAISIWKLCLSCGFKCQVELYYWRRFKPIDSLLISNLKLKVKVR
jgi:hypothetical protein